MNGPTCSFIICLVAFEAVFIAGTLAGNRWADASGWVALGGIASGVAVGIVALLVSSHLGRRP